MGGMRIIDISRPISAKEPLYPGNLSVELLPLKKFSRDGSNLSGLKMGLHSGSHVDAPRHYLKLGKSIDRVALEACVGWCRVTDIGQTSEIGEKEVRRMKPKRGEVILFKTKNSHAKGKHFDPNFAHVTEAGARALVRAGIKAVGIDGPSIRKFRLKPDTVHPLLLRRGVVIYEGLDLKNAKPGKYFFIGVPLKITEAEASPVRAILIKS